MQFSFVYSERMILNIYRHFGQKGAFAFLIVILESFFLFYYKTYINYQNDSYKRESPIN